MRNFIFILFSFSALNSIAQTGDIECAIIKGKVKQTLMLIDSLRDNYDFDSITSLNDELFQCLSDLTNEDKFQSCDLHLGYSFSYLLSLDKRFCIVSWNTREGGTMIDFTTTVIYKGKTHTGIKILKYGEGETEENTKILFDTLFTIYDNKKKQSIYVASGFGRASSQLPFRVLKAFIVSDTLIEEFELFPDNSSQLSIYYDLGHFRENDKVLDFKIQKDGKVILVPVIDEDERPTGKFYKLIFNGIKYIREQ
jgi:hypothetical protein